jgi:hypothetical protein
MLMARKPNTLEAGTMKTVENRRKVLFGMGGVVAASAAAVVAQSTSSPEVTSAAEATAAQTDEGGNKGYQLTEHVKRYYQTTLV